MEKRFLFGIGLFIILMGLMFTFTKENDKLKTNQLNGYVMAKDKETLTIQDSDNIIYTFKNTDAMEVSVGDTIMLSYTGVLNRNTEVQDNKIMDYQVSATLISVLKEEDIFGSFYEKAKQKLETLSLEEKIGQLFLVRFDDEKKDEIISKYKPAGFVFYEKDFKDKTEEEVIKMIDYVQNKSQIPLLTAVDEEGGRIVRISTNSNLVSTPFKSSSELYETGGFDLIRQDTIFKSSVLKNLGLNVNLAPVVDVSTNPDAYMYDRTLKQDTALTSEYAKTVIEASKNTGVSYTLKHFPGYGNNSDTHIASATDTRTYENILNDDLPPFKSGIESGAEAVLVSHNVVSHLDANNPASLSISIHNLLRNELKFTGIVITDDLDMGATASLSDKYVNALLSGNDLIITTDYESGFNEIKQAIQDGTISTTSLDNAVIRVLAWKYYKGLFVEKEK